MRNLAAKLKHMCQIFEAYNDISGFGYKTKYRRLIRIYAGIKPVNINGVEGLQPVRSENQNDYDTHEIIVRYDSVVGRTVRAFDDGFANGMTEEYSEGFSKSFDRGFGDGFDSIIDINPVKVNHVIYVEGTSAYNGRMFRINKVVRDDDYKEWVKFRCSEMFEKGTGGADYADSTN